MGYKLEDGEEVGPGVRRIVGEQLRDAISQLEGRGEANRDTAVHEARKDLKKARSALRLARHDIDGDLRQRENTAMRDVGRQLSGARDAQVLIETLDALAARSSGPRPPREVVAELRAELVANRSRLRSKVTGAGAGGGAAQAADELSSVLGRIEKWPIPEEGFDATGRGLRRIHRRGARAMRRALDDGDADTWHEWRKRVKDLWYSARILEPMAPAPVGGVVADADVLSDVLGLHNDLSVLDDAIAEHAARLDPGQSQLLRAALEHRRRELKLAAVPLGMRLYAEKSPVFARRLERYWDARRAQQAADAHWMSPDVAARVRRLLAEKSAAPADQRRRISAELRELDFRATDFSGMVPRRRGGFGAEDFDRLLARGVIRLGHPPAPSLAPATAPREDEPTAAPVPAEPEDWAAVVARRAVGLAGSAARRARATLPL